MGKLHKIRKAFHRITSQNELPFGCSTLAGYCSIWTGKRQNGSVCIAYHQHHLYGNAYRKFVEKLIREYNASGVAHSDKTSTKR